MHILPKPHINVLYFLNENENSAVFYILKKIKRLCCLTSFRFIVMRVRIFVAINIFNETENRKHCFI